MSCATRGDTTFFMPDVGMHSRNPLHFPFPQITQGLPVNYMGGGENANAEPDNE